MSPKANFLQHQPECRARTKSHVSRGLWLGISTLARQMEAHRRLWAPEGRHIWACLPGHHFHPLCVHSGERKPKQALSLFTEPKVAGPRLRPATSGRPCGDGRKRVSHWCRHLSPGELCDGQLLPPFHASPSFSPFSSPSSLFLTQPLCLILH